jgi:hypothetical protein
LIFGAFGFEEGSAFGPLFFGDVSQDSSRLVDGQTAEVLVEVDGSVKIQVSQVETFGDAVSIPYFKQEDSTIVLNEKSGFSLVLKLLK